MALPATTVFEVRTTGSDTQCSGGFNAARGGTDYTLQNAAQATGTVTVAGTTCTATGGIFTSAMVGNTITDGMSIREITAFTSSTVVTIDATVAWTSTTIYVGGSLATPGKAASYKVAGNDVYIQNGTYTLTNTTANTSGGPVSETTGGIDTTNQSFWVGYSTSRNPFNTDTKPVIHAGSQTNVTLFYVNNSYVSVCNIELNGNLGTSTRGLEITNSTLGNYAYRILARSCTNNGIRVAVNSLQGQVSYCAATGCTTQPAFAITAAINVLYCVAYGNSVTGFSVAPGITLVGCFSFLNSGGSSDGFDCSGGSSAVFSQCIAYGNGRHGFNSDNAFSRTSYWSYCIAYGNGGWGWNSSGARSSWLLVGCGGGSNTSGNYNSTNITPGVVGFNILTADPFIDATNGDFNINNVSGGGALLRAATFNMPG